MTAIPGGFRTDSGRNPVHVPQDSGLNEAKHSTEDVEGAVDGDGFTGAEEAAKKEIRGSSVLCIRCAQV